jgi:hypothetical protein
MLNVHAKRYFSNRDPHSYMYSCSYRNFFSKVRVNFLPPINHELIRWMNEDIGGATPDEDGEKSKWEAKSEKKTERG